MIWIRLKIQNGKDREATVIALANAGQNVKVVQEQGAMPLDTEYYVEILSSGDGVQVKDNGGWENANIARLKDDVL